MEKIEEIIENFFKNKKQISLDELLELDLNELEYETLVSKLEEKGIILVSENIEEKNYLFNYHLYHYYQSIKNIPRLKVEEEKKLIKEYQQTRNIKIRQKIVESHLKLVLHIAKPYFKYVSNPAFKYNVAAVDIMDFIQEGNRGVIRALDSFDLSKGCMFSTYAGWWIRQYMMRYVHLNSRIVKLPNYVIDNYNRIDKYILQTYKEKGYTPDTNEIAQNLGMTSKKVEETMKHTSIKIISLDTEVTVNDTEYEINYNLIEDVSSTDKSTEDYVCDKIQAEEVLKIARKILTDNQYRVLSMTYGLINEYNNCPYPMTIREISLLLNKSVERIRQLQTNSVEKISYYIKTGRLRKPRQKVK